MNWTYVAVAVAALGAGVYKLKGGGPGFTLTTYKAEKDSITIVVKDDKNKDHVYYLDGKYWHNNKDHTRVTTRLNEKLNELVKSYQEKKKKKNG